MKSPEKHILRSPTASHWEKIGIHHHHGVCAPLFSLRSAHSCGIGEFFDLKLLIDWCASLGMDTIQLLPLNESGSDPSPYNALTSCGLDPIYLSLQQLPYIVQHPELEKKIQAFHPLTLTPRISYSKVRKLKFSFLSLYYRYFFSEIELDEEYQRFISQNSWLHEYAFFRVLKDRYGKKTWQQWPPSLRDIPSSKLAEFYKKHASEMNFYYFVQYLAFSQMIAVKKYAESKKVLLIGDIPYLISPHSLDVWTQRRIFDTSHVAGTPPDMFNAYGQKWGFYLFNWEAQKKDHYAWWHQRLNVASSCYHAYRIDHAVGFFRIWAMQLKEDPVNGKFLPKNPDKWFSEGKKRLMMLIKASLMFPIAEDLGLIPKEVYAILEEFGIPGMKVLRWERTRYRYKPLSAYSPISMTITGTHDTETLAQWWINHPKEAKMLCNEKKWSYSSSLRKDQRLEILSDAHHSSSLFHVNPLQEYLALFPSLVAKNIDDERINIPGRSVSTNWTYRFRPYLEEIIAHKRLSAHIRTMLPKRKEL
ncbi:MAG: 4-alpha-glucanotransferase [Parachlamydiales bacterium]|nr:4-alpha-glucanotransferase [Parachlamydiales bacterium]